MTPPVELQDPQWLKFAVPLATFAAGVVANQLFLARKDRLTQQQNRFTNIGALLEKQEKAYLDYTQSLLKYTAPPKSRRSKKAFDQIAVCGDNHFRVLRNVGDAILSGDVSALTRDNTCIPLLREAVERSLPEHYSALRAIAKEQDFAYNGELRRENYESIYVAVERYGHSAAWRAVRGDPTADLLGE